MPLYDCQLHRAMYKLLFFDKERCKKKLCLSFEILSQTDAVYLMGWLMDCPEVLYRFSWVLEDKS